MPSNQTSHFRALRGRQVTLAGKLRLAAFLCGVTVCLSGPALSLWPASAEISRPAYQLTSSAGEAERREPATQGIPFAPILGRYKRHLFDQGRGRWQALPCALISVAQPHYPQIDLARVRFAQDIATLHGRAITWHYHVFFPWQVDLTKKLDFFVMLHELEHVVQYEERGGEQAFLTEYIQKAIAQATARGTWRVHGDIDLEQAAKAKAMRVFKEVYGAFQSARSTAKADLQSPSTCRTSG